jgi:hypothetical protein
VPTALQERTPQRIGSARFTLGKAKRARLIKAQATAAFDAHVSHATFGLNRPTGQQIVAACRTQLGVPYCAYGCRCEVGCRCHDCSGLPCFACNLLGLPHICTSSFGFAALGRQMHLEISREVALHTPGSVAIRNPFGSSNANGSNGHIVVMVGDGTDATIEERGTAYGCVEYHESGRGFSFYMRLPNVNYVAPAPPSPKVEPMLILDKNPKHVSHPARTRSASVDAAGNIFLGNDARIAGDGARKTINGVRVVVPPANGAPFMGAAESGGGFTLQFLQKDLSFADFHYEFVS